MSTSEDIKNWWIDCLNQGKINDKEWNKIYKKDLYDDYQEKCIDSCVSHFVFWKNMEAFGIPMFEFLPSLNDCKESLNLSYNKDNEIDNVLNWWVNCLHQGKINNKSWNNINKKDLYSYYQATCIGEPINLHQFWIKMDNLGLKFFSNLPNLKECKENYEFYKNNFNGFKSQIHDELKY